MAKRLAKLVVGGRVSAASAIAAAAAWADI